MKQGQLPGFTWKMPFKGGGDGTALESVTTWALAMNSRSSAPATIFDGCGPAARSRGIQSKGSSVAEPTSTRLPILAETQILKGRRFGNLVLVGSATELPFDWMPRLLAAGPHPSKIVAGAELREFIASAQVVTDASAVPSPPPSKGIFQVKPGS